jgi:ubiquinone/menaquinone biosynthesis C-methylase UbiE
LPNQPLPQNPSGLIGQLFGKVMEWTNGNAYRKALQSLNPKPQERFLELGFGTGRCAELLLSETAETFLAGLDPTATMVQTALNRLTRRGLNHRIDLRQGTDAVLPWKNQEFDGIIAIHCFQFWPDPAMTLMEINRVLKPTGRIVIVFRDHSTRAPDWLPNPLSRSGKEIELMIDLLEKHHYRAIEQPAAGSSRIIRAEKCSENP